MEQIGDLIITVTRVYSKDKNLFSMPHRLSN